MFNTLLLALMLVAPATSAPPQQMPIPPSITLQMQPDDMTIAFVIQRGNNYSAVSLADFEKAAPHCKTFDITMFDKPDLSGIYAVVRCML